MRIGILSTPWTIYQGSTFRFGLRLKAGRDGPPVDLSGCQARMQFRRAWNASDIVWDLSTAASTLTLGGTAGTIRGIIDAEASAAVSATKVRRGVFDCELYYPDGDTWRAFKGLFILDPEVTR